VGGFDGSTGLNSAEMYDPRTHEWRMIAPMSTRRSSVGVGVVNGLLYAVSYYCVMAGLFCHMFYISGISRFGCSCVPMWFLLSKQERNSLSLSLFSILYLHLFQTLIFKNNE